VSDLKEEYRLSEEFRSRATNIVDNLITNINAAPIPNIIYHYTDGAGFLGILQTGKLWLHDVFSLNDPSELNHGISLLSQIMTKEVRSHATSPEALQFIKDFKTIRKAHEAARFFVCCFSKCKDDLAQWRAYADNGRGYALGFDSKTLTKAFANWVPPECQTFSVTYNDEKLRQLDNRLAKEVFSFIYPSKGQNLSDTAIYTYMWWLREYLLEAAIGLSLYFKHEGYANEREYRFLRICTRYDPLASAKTRQRHYVLSRYLEFDWQNDGDKILKEIVVGPAGGTKTKRFATECLREFYGNRNVIVSRSKIPYSAV
jgi:hypothetical protein